MPPTESKSPVEHLRRALTSSAPTPAARSALEQDVAGLMLRRLGVTGLVFAAIHLIAYGVAMSTSRMLSWTIPFDRIAVVALALGCFALGTRKRLARHAFPLSVVLILGTVAYILSFIPRFGVAEQDLPGITLLTVAPSVLFPYTMRQMLGVAAAVFASYLAMAVWSMAPGEAPLLARGIFWCAASSLTAVVASHLSFRLREREFYARYELEEETRKAEQLLLNILPRGIVERLKREPQAIADAHAETTVLFADIVGFTAMSSGMSPASLVSLLNELFSEFDRITEKHGLEKIKTIGDAYMVAGGIPEHRADHAQAVALMALEMRDLAGRFKTPAGDPLGIRIGINSGPIVAGVIGTKKFLYYMWGDAVNTASRMESHAEPGMIQVTGRTAELLGDDFVVERRGTVQVKGKGDMDTFLPIGSKPLNEAGPLQAE